jgi:hypothetical protein
MCINSVIVSGIVESVPTPNHFILNSDDEIIHCVCEGELPVVGENIEVKGSLRSRMYRLYGKNIVLIEVKESFRKVN